MSMEMSMEMSMDMIMSIRKKPIASARGKDIS